MEKASRAYQEVLKERKKTSRVYSIHQSVGLEIAELLEDRAHKAIYILFAKNYDRHMLLSLARDISERKNVNNKGAYFMRMLQKERADNAERTKKYNKEKKI